MLTDTKLPARHHARGAARGSILKATSDAGPAALDIRPQLRPAECRPAADESAQAGGAPRRISRRRCQALARLITY